MRLVLISLALLALPACRHSRAARSPDDVFAKAMDVTSEARFRFFFETNGRLHRYDCPPEALASAGNLGDPAAAFRDAARLCQASGPSVPMVRVENDLQGLPLTSLEQRALRDLLRSLGTRPGQRAQIAADPLVRPPFDVARARFAAQLDASFNEPKPSAKLTTKPVASSTADMQTARFPSVWDEGSAFILVMPRKLAAKSLAEIAIDVRGNSGDTCAHVRAEPVRLTDEHLHVRLTKILERTASCRLLARTVEAPVRPLMRPVSPLRLWSHLWFGIRTAWPWMSEGERRQLAQGLGAAWRRPPREREDALVPHRGEELFYANRMAGAKVSAERPPELLLEPEGLRSLSLAEWGDIWDLHLMQRAGRGELVELPHAGVEHALTAWLTANGYRTTAARCPKKDKACYQWKRTWLAGQPTTYPKLAPPIQRFLRLSSLTPWPATGDAHSMRPSPR